MLTNLFGSLKSQIEDAFKITGAVSLTVIESNDKMETPDGCIDPGVSSWQCQFTTLGDAIDELASTWQECAFCRYANEEMDIEVRNGRPMKKIHLEDLGTRLKKYVEMGISDANNTHQYRAQSGKYDADEEKKLLDNAIAKRQVFVMEAFNDSSRFFARIAPISVIGYSYSSLGSLDAVMRITPHCDGGT